MCDPGISEGAEASLEREDLAMSRLSGNTKKQRINRLTDQRGMILVVTLMIVLILALLGSAFLTTSGTEHQIAKNDQEIVQALYVAEGGLQTAINQCKAGCVPSATGFLPPEEPHVGEYTVTVSDASPPAGQQWIVATGFVPSQTSPRAMKQIAVLVQKPPPFGWPIFGDTGVTINPGTTNSYDSANGPYGGGNVGSNGDVGSNGNITLLGQNTQVNGDAAAVGTVSDPTKVTGTSTNGAPPTPLPGVACPSGGYTQSLSGSGISYNPSSGDLTIDAHGDLRLSAPGTYYFHNVTISGQGTITVASAGHVDIYIGGMLNLSSNNSIVNTSGLPAGLSIWGCGTDTSVWAVSGGNSAYFGLYSPNHPLTVSGNSPIWGSLIASSITVNGNAKIHYDEALARGPGPGGKISIVSGSWTELVL